MNSTTRKITLIILAIVTTFIGVRIVKSFAPEKKESTAKSVKKSVRIIQLTPSTHKAQVTFSGKVEAYQKIDVYSEVNGVLLNDDFRTGNSFKKGQTIVQLNGQEFENNVKSAKSQLSASLASTMGDIKVDYSDHFTQWNEFLTNLNVGKPLAELPEAGAKLKNFLQGKGIYKQYYSIKSQEDKLSKYTIRAPYDGMAIQSLVNKGTVVRAGQKIGTFANGELYELESEVSLSDLKFVKVGNKIKLNSDELNKSWTGVIARINNVIDPASQMIKIYVSVQGNDLKDGMFLQGLAQGMQFENSIQINRKLIHKNGVYIVVDGAIVFKQLKVLHTSGSKAIVEGLSKDDWMVGDNMKGLFEGLEVNVLK